MKALINKLSLLLITLTLTSCGGGSGGAFQAPAGTAQVASLSAAPSTTTISPNNFVDISVTAKNTDNSLAKDGTTISAILTPASIGIITTGGAVTGGTTASGLSTGGLVAFRFSSGVNIGVAHMVFSTSNAAGSTISTALDINVNGGSADNRLTLTPNTITLPLNPSPGSFPFFGSPYLGEVTITRRHQNGQLITGTEKDNTSIAPVQIAAFSTLDDPTTPWTGQTTTPQTAAGNEFLNELSSGPVSVTGGQGTIFIHAQSKPGTATLMITATDADSGQTISASLTVNVVSTIPPLPTTVLLSAQGNAVYISSSGGNSSTTIRALVESGAGLTVPDPTSGNTAYNNIQFEIVGDNPGHASLSALDASGQQSPVGATIVKTRTFSGIANIVFNAGTTTGPIQIKATVDRADNNVENPGISDPVSSTVTVNVSDGNLYALAIASPVVSGLAVNSVSGKATSTGVTPADPNGTYSIIQSVTGKDRAGNPPLLGTVINFGLVDSPVVNRSDLSAAGSFVNFSIAGQFGDPDETKSNFTAIDGHFQTAGGGAGPGDTLLVFGHSTTFDGFVAPAGNRDLEGSRTIQSIISDTSLTVNLPFNANDDTGVSVNNLAVIPYVIGHAIVGNITASGTTNVAGVATATMTYPASHLGQYAYVWAQASVTTATGTKTVGEISKSGYPGVAPAALSVPSTIVGNTTTVLQVCVTDALSQPISNQAIGFHFEHIGSGVATIDGSVGGIFAHPTDANGCATGLIVTSGLTNTGSAQPDVVISADGQTSTVTISVGGPVVLQASPSSFISPGGQIVLTLTDDHGQAIKNVAISAVCTTGASVGTLAVTDINGMSQSTISATGLDKVITPLTATCTFKADGATATVNVTGRDICVNTPNATGCPAPKQSVVTINASNSGASTKFVQGNVTLSGTSSNAVQTGGCSISGNNTLVTCPFTLDQGTSVNLAAKATGQNTLFDGWFGSCGVVTQTTTTGTAFFTVSASPVSCTASFKCTTATCP
jgi:hypothetical protein